MTNPTSTAADGDTRPDPSAAETYPNVLPAPEAAQAGGQGTAAPGRADPGAAAPRRSSGSRAGLRHRQFAWTGHKRCDHLECIVGRFMARVTFAPSGCWIWLGALNGSGYGSFGMNRKAYGAHVVAHELFLGPVPIDHQVDHLCRVRRCVNPLHLQAVMPAVNLKRAGALAAAIRARQSRPTCPAGHPKTAENLAVNGNGRVFCRPCGRAASLRHYHAKKARVGG